jgi:Rhs element Vgr protein
MPPETPLLSQVYIKLGGSDAPAELMTVLRGVEVDLDLSLPAMCRIEINDGGFRWADDARLRLGQDIEIGARSAEDERGAPTKLFNGQIVGAELDLREHGVAFLVIRAFDRLHLLTRGKKSRVFTQATDADIVSNIAREHGLQPAADPTPDVHKHIYQHNQTDLEFLRIRAERNGYFLWVEDRKLNFKKPQNAERQRVDLDYGKTLMEFHPRKAAASQVKQAYVRGWDPQNKRAFVGHASAADYQVVKAGEGKRISAMVQQAFGVSPGDHQVTDRPISSQAEGDTMAKAVLARLWATDVRAEGLAHGDPRLLPGARIKVEGIGTQFGGEYFVSGARHTLDSEGHYFTHLTIAGFEAATTADLILNGAVPAASSGGPVAHGLAIGIVTNNNDPENVARVKVKFPWLSDETESDWARVVMPMAGPERGFFWLPEVNDEVLVAFEHGDFNQPFVVGSLWNGTDKPPLTSSAAVGGGKVNKRIIKTRAGHVIMLDDTSGAEKIEVIDKTGRNKIVIDSASGKVTVEAQNDIELKATNITLQGRAKVAISAPQVEVSGTGRVKVQGGMVEIN